MAIPPVKKYSTAIFAYSPPASTSGNADALRDPQAVQAALGHLINTVREQLERRSSKSQLNTKSNASIKSSRWFLQIRTLRLAVPGEGQSSSTRMMFMARNAAEPDSLTLVIEDQARAAVNISSLAASSFDYYMSTGLLLPMGNRDAATQSQSAAAGGGQPSQQVDPREQLQRNQSSRWIPRPSFAQIEGVTLVDPSSDFRISIGMISGRGGTAGSGAAVGPDLVIQLEYLPTPFLPSPTAYGMLEDYLNLLVPKYSRIRDVSAETTSFDWKSLLGISPDSEDVPAWSPRNTSWCLVRLCKDARML